MLLAVQGNLIYTLESIITSDGLGVRMSEVWVAEAGGGGVLAQNVEPSLIVATELAV